MSQTRNKWLLKDNLPIISTVFDIVKLISSKLMNKVYVDLKVLEMKSIKSSQVVWIDPARIMNHMSKFILCILMNSY